ncbi:MAG TPA: Ig-like domain-containing protein [Candidatus Krumholzibacteria bacterium]|nr:Ig-like domain-containing protein [Candidatus Krumholzibacteria bacterium]HPD72236.1 Ig-like domain-containing protein [Candidatus Krumholzibacteria bacterium]HRY40832.1 Ig-like domain-containing protein [Candidatus Krumholzibacteria bacterium]
MTTGRFIALALLANVLPYATARATTRVVDPGGGGDFTAIQPALAAAAPGDLVLVVPGTYTGPDNRNLDFGGKDLTLRSTNGAAATTIDAENAGRAFTFDSGESGAATVDGFTIIRAPAGSALRIAGGASPTIRDCRFEGNAVAGAPGGAVSCLGSSPVFEDCLFVDNSSDQHAGAVHVQGGEPVFAGCTFVGNRSGGRGGAVWCEGAASVTVTGCTISGNAANLGAGAFNGGGIAVTGGAHLALTRTIVWGNRADVVDDLFVAAGASAAIGCSDVDASGTGGAGAIDFGAGVLTGDPHFCQPAYCRTEPWQDGDYGLAANSPCLPANNPCGVLIGAWPQGCGDVVVWTGAAGTTAWENPLNWSTHSLPEAGDNVQITTGDVVLSSTAEIGWLTQCNESDAPELVLTIAAGGHLRLDGVADPAKAIEVATVTSDKTVIENGGDASTGNTPHELPHPWELLGTLDLRGGSVRGFLTVDSGGTIAANGGGSFGPDVTVINRGSGLAAKTATPGGLLIESGTLAVEGTLQNLGEVAIAAGATLQLDGVLDNQVGSSLALAGHLAGAGSLTNLGAVTKSGPSVSDVAVAVANLRTPDPGAAGTITVSEGTWRAGGALTNEGVLTIGAGATLQREGTVWNLADGVVALGGDIAGNGTLANLGLVRRNGPGSSSVAGLLANLPDAATGERGRLAVLTGALTVAGLDNGGVTTVAGGATVTATGHLTNDSDAVLAGGGTVDVATAVFANPGRVRPGSSLGILTVVGDYTTTPTSRLFFELGGALPGVQHDQLAVTGSAALGGSLHVSLTDGFAPAPGDTFTVITAGAGGVEVAFDCYSGLAIGPDLWLEPVALYDRLLLVATTGGPDNQPPVAADDDVTVSATAPATLSPLVNDVDPNGDPLTIVSVVVDATAGTARVAPGGETIAYWPPAESAALDELDYLVTDCAGAVDSARVAIHFGETGVEPPAPAYRLHPNAPNPFNPITRIRFDTPRAGPVRVAVYDLRGRLVQALVSGNREAGSHEVTWSGRNRQGGDAPAGVYLVRLEAPGAVAARKMTLVR